MSSNRQPSNEFKSDETTGQDPEAIQIDPEDAGSYNNRGLAYKAQGKLDKAIQDYTQAIQLEPKYARACRNLAIAYNDRGSAYQKQKNFVKAIQYYEQCIKVEPERLPKLVADPGLNVKEEILQSIIIYNLEHSELQTFLFKALLPTTFLGKIFHFKRGLREVSLQRGTLSQAAFKLEENVLKHDLLIKLEIKNEIRKQSVEWQKALLSTFPILHTKLVAHGVLYQEPTLISKEIPAPQEEKFVTPASAPEPEQEKLEIPTPIESTSKIVTVPRDLKEPSAPVADEVSSALNLNQTSDLKISSILSSAPKTSNIIKRAEYIRIAELCDQLKTQQIQIPSEVEEKYLCPISQTLMLDPVVAADGYVYDRKSIQDWINNNSQNPEGILSPETGEPLEHANLSPSQGYRKAIIHFLSELLPKAPAIQSQTSNQNLMFQHPKELQKDKFDLSQLPDVPDHAPGTKVAKEEISKKNRIEMR